MRRVTKLARPTITMDRVIARHSVNLTLGAVRYTVNFVTERSLVQL